MWVKNESLGNIDPEVEKLLHDIAKDERLLKYEVNKFKCVKSDGYHGIISSTEICGASDSAIRTLDLIIKTACKNETLRVQTPLANMFHREIYMYNTVLPTFQKFLKGVGLPALQIFPKFYKASTIDKHEAVLFENLSCSGYQLCDRMKPMNEEHVALVMRECGRFHALSFALKDQKPREFDFISSSLNDIYCSYITRCDFIGAYKKLGIKAAETLTNVEEKEDYKRFLYNTDLLENLPKLVDEYSVILHGDCWTNNIMFRYDDLLIHSSACKTMWVKNESLGNIDPEVEKLLHDIAKDERLLKYEVNKFKCVKSDGYHGIISSTEICGASDSAIRTLDLIIKTACKNETLRVQTPLANMFHREIYMYNTVLPTFQKFLKGVGLPALQIFPKFYKASTIDKHEAVLFENLSCSGYQLCDRMKPMNEEHVALVMRECGRFHALSFALKDQKPREFDFISSSLDDIYCSYITRCDFIGAYKKVGNRAAQTLTNVKEKEDCKRFLDNTDLLENLPKLVDEYSVILHGDCWTNNIMFGYDDAENPETPTKLCFLDLQLSRLGPPVIDLAYFFYTCSSAKIITNYEEYLDMYYNTLSTCLNEMGSAPEKQYPRTVFQRQWKEYAKFGLLTSLFMIKLALTEEHEATDFAEIAENGNGFANGFDYDLKREDEYYERARHIITHFVTNNFI